jgi:hypothetical protein
MLLEYCVIAIAKDRVFVCALELNNRRREGVVDKTIEDVQRWSRGRRVIYRDSSGIWTELRIDSRNFVQFATYSEYVPNCEIEYVR